MARYAYDVNTTTRLIDVHKQFSGGLKTVDTDDALGAVFLREAENVSLSEFGFLEKRYGTFENFKIAINGTLQGYWEFNGFSIYAVDGRFYYFDGTTQTPVTTISQENTDWRYPTLPQYDSSTGFAPVNNVYRDMNAVNINNVLYIFTGYYPVYVKIVNNAPVFYWFSVNIPTYDEIVVVGHNLLEDDYDEVYGFTTPNEFQIAASTTPLSVNDVPRIVKTDFYPKFPFVQHNGQLGSVNFEFVSQFPADMDSFSTSSTNPYYEIRLDSIRYRTALPGATDLSYTEVDLSSATFTNKSNYNQIGETPLPALEFIKNVVSEQYLKEGETDYIVSANLHRYDMFKEFLVDKTQFLKNNTYVIKTFRKYVDSISAYNLSQYATGDFGENLFTIKITPVDVNNTELTDYTQKLITGQVGNTFKFSIPTTLYRRSDVSYYKISFEHTVIEDDATPSGPTNLKTDYESYLLQLTVVGEKSASTSGNQIFSGSVPALRTSLTNLTAGRYDFEITFARDEYNYQSSLLTYVGTELFSGTVFDVEITSEKLQDFPGITEDFLPKLNPIWTCNKVIEHFGKLMVWGSKEMPSSIFYSFPDRPFYFPSKFYLDFGNDSNIPVQAVTNFLNVLIVQTEDATWGVKGNSGLIDSPAPYTPFTVNPTVGTIAYKSVRPVRNKLFFLSKQGVVSLNSLYAVDEMYNIKFEDLNIRNIVPQDSKAIGIQYDNQYWLNFPKYGITLRWYIDKNAWVLDRFGSYTNTLGNVIEKPGAWKEFNGIFKWQITNGKLEFITYPSQFETTDSVSLYKIGVDYSLPYDLGDTITSKFQTSFLNQNYPFHPKNYKEFKYDFTIQNEYNPSRTPLFDSFQTISSSSSYAFPNTIDLKRNHTYLISFESQVVPTSVTIDTEVIDLTPIDINESGVITDFKFLANNEISDNLNSVTITFDGETTYSGRISIKDTTYDEILQYKTKMLTEDNVVLNQEVGVGYVEKQEDIDIDLASFQDFTFGTSTFGDKITVVKTVKLSGKGYNIKTYFEDTTASKWVIESMGVTYKMKRARSR